MKPVFRFGPFIIAGVGIFCGCQSSPLHEAAPATIQQSTGVSNLTNTADGFSTVPHPLVALNKLFLDAYKERQAFVKTNTSPLIVADFSSLILYWNGVTETNLTIPAVYHALKTMAHVPFGIYLRVDPYSRRDTTLIPQDVVDELESYLENIRLSEMSLQDAGFSSEQSVRQHLILAECKAYLTNVFATGRASRPELLSFAHRVAPLMLANADEAAAAQLDRTHAAVMRWKRKIPPEEWKQLVVVVRGFQMPRRLNILTQYFAKVLNEPSHKLGYPLESRRLIYAEFIMNNKDHLDLMATTFIDGDASEVFFGDRWRMSRDVLADGAKAYLKQIKID